MEKLKELREKKDLSLNSMAKILGISKSYYYQLENKKRNLSYKMAIKISDVFGLNPDDIFLDEFKKRV